jgi:hypothetical protein
VPTSGPIGAVAFAALGMAYDEALANPVREALAPRVDLSERKMWIDAAADFAASLPPR